MSSNALGDVALVSNGKTPPVSEQRDSGFPVLKIRDVDALGNFRGPFASFVDGPFAEKFSAKHLERGDTLILNAAHNADYVASKMFYAKSSLGGPLVTGEWTIVRPNPAKADSAYVRHFIESSTAKKQLKEMVNGIHLYPKDVARLAIPLPSLPEQRRIATILDKADALRAKRREAIVKLNQLLQSVFLDMFGDPVSNPKGWDQNYLTDSLELTNGRAFKSSEWTTSGFPIIRIQNVKRPQEPFNYFQGSFEEKHLVKRGDILLCWAGQLVSIGVHRWDREEGLLNQHIFKVTPKFDSDLDFVACMLGFIIEKAKSNFRGIEMKHLTKADLARASIVIPPIALQRKFANISRKIADASSHHKKSNSDIERLFSALQQQAFSI